MLKLSYTGGNESDTSPPVWDFDCTGGLTFWINKYDYIANQNYSDMVFSPNVTDDTGVRTLTFPEAVDLRAPVFDDVSVTWVATDFADHTNSCVIAVRVKRKWQMYVSLL